MLDESTILSKSLIELIQENSLAIDSGISRSKIVFILREESQEKSLRSLSIINEQLENYLRQLNSILKDESINKIYLTGFKVMWVKEIVKSIFDIDAITIDETIALSNGIDLISNNLKLSDLEIEFDEKSLNLDKYKIDINNPMIAQFRNAMKIKFDKNDITDELAINIPCILVMAGATTKFFLVNKDKSVKLLNTTFYSGETLRGLSKCLIDTNNYQNLMAAAGKGNRENTDTQVWEVMSENESSPYGKLPPHLPIFAFGKCADNNKGKEEFSPNDLLESLCHLIFSEMNIQTIQLCKLFKLKSIYYCGGIFADPIFAKFSIYRNKVFSGDLTVKILKCDYIFALGSMKKN